MRPLPTRSLLIVYVAVAAFGCGSTTPPPTIVPPAAPSSASPPSSATLPPLADVSFYRADPAALAIQAGPGPTAKPELAWRVNLGRTHTVPILVGGRLIVGTDDGRLVALDGHTGEQEWTFSGSGPFNTLPASANGLAYASDGSAIHAVDVATGTKRWTTPVNDAAGRVNVVDDVVYVGTTGGVVGMDAATGEIVWRWVGPQNVAVLAGPIVDGVGYFAARDGRVYAVDTQTGEGVWSVQTISLDVATSAVVGETVYVGTNQGEASEPVGEIYAIDRSSGGIRWRFRAPSGLQLNAGPVRDGVLYASGRQDGIYALRDDGSTPTVLWHVGTPESHWPMALVGETLYEVRTDGSMGAYAIADGKLLWDTEAQGDWAGGPIVSGGMVFLANDTEGVMAFADQAVIALLPEPVALASPSPTPPSSGPNPFTTVRAFSWAETGIGVPLGMEAGPDGLLYVLDAKPEVTVIDPTDGRVVREWGRQGAGPGEFEVTDPSNNPGFGDIAVAPDGRVYVADGANHRVQVFSPQGRFQFQFGSFGTGEGQFGSINEIAIGPDGSVYVQDGLISKFTPDGKFEWRTDFLFGIDVRSDGVLLGTCEGCGEIRLLDPTDGRVRERWQWPSEGDGFGQLGIDPAGNVYDWTYGPQAQVVLDPDGRLITAVQPQEEVGLGKTITWGDLFWPSPVFLPDGRAFAFGKAGLIELSINLPGS